MRDAVEPTLSSAGFRRDRERLTWVREAGELLHVVAILRRRDICDVQWSVVSLEVSELIWGLVPERVDVGYHIMSGTPSNIRRPAPGQSWRLDTDMSAEDVEVIVRDLHLDLDVIASRLSVFRTRRQVRDYLLENRDPIDRRDFLIPANLPLKLVVVTALAIADGDAVACGLLAETEVALAPYQDAVTRERRSRLQAAARPLCGDH